MKDNYVLIEVLVLVLVGGMSCCIRAGLVPFLHEFEFTLQRGGVEWRERVLYCTLYSACGVQ